MSKRFDKRLHFIREALNVKVTGSAPTNLQGGTEA